ncbi:hypothetical protein JMM81_04810 [Bacillus sp. V3B]|uniref:UPF0738 family protein n=1 Tax=Bacillus sp. V3B TaxID=2804915 RepID=UPI00210DB2BE|nr:hypothetical protein [Bacillus sp. V3B]MCQ6274297.1 hypothetical protein [Bacillus sp. V3B]
MNERLIIKNALIKNDTELQLEIDSSHKLIDLRASGQILVDSDGFSFIYLLENDNTYTYISIPETVWHDLKTAVSNNLPVIVTNGSDQILLTGFQEELTYLVENIKGNSNYGEEMVNKVEAVFA